jgi:Ca2+-binding EF-hand superfamily protein
MLFFTVIITICLFSSELRNAFELFDQDHNGCISCTELLTVMHRLRQQVSEEEIRDMISQVDIDGSVFTYNNHHYIDSTTWF